MQGTIALLERRIGQVELRRVRRPGPKIRQRHVAGHFRPVFSPQGDFATADHEYMVPAGRFAVERSDLDVDRQRLRPFHSGGANGQMDNGRARSKRPWTQQLSIQVAGVASISTSR